MKPSQIEVGKTYINKGAGKTQRTVIAIGESHKPKTYWNATGENPNKDDTGVLYEQNGKQNNLYLTSFAAWCGSEA